MEAILSFKGSCRLGSSWMGWVVSPLSPSFSTSSVATFLLSLFVPYCLLSNVVVISDVEWCFLSLHFSKSKLRSALDSHLGLVGMYSQRQFQPCWFLLGWGFRFINGRSGIPTYNKELRVQFGQWEIMITTSSVSIHTWTFWMQFC